jgi:hypothetical protein
MKVTLSANDLRLVAQLSRFTSTSDPDLQYVCALPEKENLLWVATDQRCLATFSCGSWHGDASAFGLPLRELRIATELCEWREVDEVELEVSSSSGALHLPGLTLPFAGSAERVLDVYKATDELAAPERYFQTNTEDLAHVVHAAMAPPLSLKPSDRKQFWLTVDAERATLLATSSWVGHADTFALVACEASSSYEVAVDPTVLLDMAIVSGHEVIRLESGDDYRTPVRMTTASGLSVLAMPQLFGLDADRPVFERTLAAFVGMDANDLQRDEDGDYWFNLRSGDVLYFRLQPEDAMARVPRHLSIFIILAQDVPLNLDTLEEINAQNRRVPFARLYRTESGAVLLEAHCMLEGLDEVSLQTTVELVADLAEKVGPWMRDFFGSGGDPESADLE